MSVLPPSSSRNVRVSRGAPGDGNPGMTRRSESEAPSVSASRESSTASESNTASVSLIARESDASVSSAATVPRKAGLPAMDIVARDVAAAGAGRAGAGANARIAATVAATSKPGLEGVPHRETHRALRERSGRLREVQARLEVPRAELTRGLVVDL